MSDDNVPDWLVDIERRVVQAYIDNGLLASPYNMYPHVVVRTCCGIGALCFGKFKRLFGSASMMAAEVLGADPDTVQAFFAGFDDGLTGQSRNRIDIGYVSGVRSAEAVIAAGLKYNWGGANDVRQE